MDPVLHAGVDDDGDEDTSLAGVHGDNTSLTGVLKPTTTVATNNDDDSDAEPNHNSVDPNRADKNSSKISIHSTGSHIPVQSMTTEPPQCPLDVEDPDDIELPELETQVSVLH